MATVKKRRSGRKPRESGYVPCKCRDCMDTAIADDVRKGAFCHQCKAAGCPDYQGVRGMSQECQRSDSYDSDWS